MGSNAVSVTNQTHNLSPDGAGAQLTVTATASSLADLGFTVPATAKYVQVQVQANAIRFTFDGTAPTASVGFRSESGLSPFYWSRAEALVVEIIEEATGSKLQVQGMGH